MNALTAAIGNASSVQPPWVVVATATSDVSMQDTAFAPITTVLAGFAVDSVVFSDSDFQWVITAR